MKNIKNQNCVIKTPAVIRQTKQNGAKNTLVLFLFILAGTELQSSGGKAKHVPGYFISSRVVSRSVHLPRSSSYCSSGRLQSVVTHVANSYANLLRQKNAFT